MAPLAIARGAIIAAVRARRAGSSRTNRPSCPGTLTSPDPWMAPGLTAGASSHLPKHQVGALRDAQGWIGGTSPLDAALVPPPLEHVPALMDDLVVFVNRADLDDVVRAAGQATTNLIHAVADLQTSWDARLTGVRAGAAARRVLAVLPQYPVLDAATLAHALGVSERASRTALNTLELWPGTRSWCPSTRTAARSAGPANGGSPKNSSTSSPPGHAESARPRPRPPGRRTTRVGLVADDDRRLRAVQAARLECRPTSRLLNPTLDFSFSSRRTLSGCPGGRRTHLLPQSRWTMRVMRGGSWAEARRAR